MARNRQANGARWTGITHHSIGSSQLTNYTRTCCCFGTQRAASKNLLNSFFLIDHLAEDQSYPEYRGPPAQDNESAGTHTDEESDPPVPWHAGFMRDWSFEQTFPVVECEIEVTKKPKRGKVKYSFETFVVSRLERCLHCHRQFLFERVHL